MTVVRHKFLRPSPAGDVPYSLELRFRPSRSRVLDGDPKAVVVPAEFAEDLPAGVLNVDLAPTGPGWCWEIFRPYGKIESLREWVVVPEPVADPDRPGEFLPVDYPDLVRVDPASLEPSAEPSPLWWAELEAAKALASDVEAARVAAAGSAVEAGSARDDAVVAAGEASGFAGDAAGSASVAVAAAGSAGTDADTAAARAGEAGLARTAAESARDATVAAAGGSEASAALAAGAAVESAESAADAKRDAGVIIEMTETGRLSETALIATIGDLSGPVIDAKVAPVMASAQGVVDRANAGDFDGADGAPGNATIRVDATAGRRLLITDGATEYMARGLTGPRRLSDYFLNGAAAVSEPPTIWREGNTVHVALGLKLTGWVYGTPAFQIPLGFRAVLNWPPYLPDTAYAGAGSAPLLLNTAGEIVVYASGNISARFQWSWPTGDAWPIPLPGTVGGPTPNL